MRYHGNSLLFAIKKHQFFLGPIFLVLLITLFTTPQSFAQHRIPIKVEKYLPTEFDQMFEIVSPLPFSLVLLDCQSFIQGIGFFEDDKDDELENPYNFFLYPRECESIHRYIVKSVDNDLPVCIELDFKDNNFYLSHKSKDCQ